MRISFWLRPSEEDSLKKIRKDTQEFIEDLLEWQKKEDNRHHEISVYVNQR